jgi:hypothetical protein
MPRMLAFAVIFLVGTACHFETKRDQQIDERDNSTKAEDVSQVETKKQDPSDVETRTTRSDNALVIQEEDGTSQVLRVPREGHLVLRPGAKVVGTVPLAQTVVEQSKHLGAAETEKVITKKSNEQDGKTVTTKTKEDDTTDVGFSLKFYLLAGGGLILLAALGWFLAHSKLVRRLLGEP